MTNIYYRKWGNCKDDQNTIIMQYINMMRLNLISAQLYILIDMHYKLSTDLLLYIKTYDCEH